MSPRVGARQIECTQHIEGSALPLTSSLTTNVFATSRAVPYLTGNNSFISYDDPQSIGEKVSYCRQHGFKGVMWWEASEDPESLLLIAGNDAALASGRSASANRSRQ